MVRKRLFSLTIRLFFLGNLLLATFPALALEEGVVYSNGAYIQCRLCEPLENCSGGLCGPYETCSLLQGATLHGLPTYTCQDLYGANPCLEAGTNKSLCPSGQYCTGQGACHACPSDNPDCGQTASIHQTLDVELGLIPANPPGSDNTTTGDEGSGGDTQTLPDTNNSTPLPTGDSTNTTPQSCSPPCGPSAACVSDYAGGVVCRPIASGCASQCRAGTQCIETSPNYFVCIPTYNDVYMENSTTGTDTTNTTTQDDSTSMGMDNPNGGEDAAIGADNGVNNLGGGEADGGDLAAMGMDNLGDEGQDLTGGEFTSNADGADGLLRGDTDTGPTFGDTGGGGGGGGGGGSGDGNPLLPEFNILALPVSFALAGLLVYRSRKRHRRK